MYRFDIHAAQIQGGRPRQEDCWGFHNVGGMLCSVLADGLGGHRCGDIAAQLTVDQVLGELQSAISDDPRRPPAVNLRAAARKAREAVNRYGLTHPECARMAATLVAVSCIPPAPATACCWVSPPGVWLTCTGSNESGAL